MKLTFLGSGDAFVLTENNFQSNVLIEAPNGSRLLIDCGSDIRNSLHALGYTYSNISAVYISHLHADHVGGLEWLGFSTFFDSRAKTPELFLHESLVDKLWDNCLSGGMAGLDEKEATLESYFKVSPLKKKFSWEGIHFELIEMTHIFNCKEKQPCYGLFFTVGGKKFLFTSDTRFIPDTLMPYYKKADLIFHECETAPYKSGVHCHYSELVTLPSDIKKKIWLYHYNQGSLPDAKKDGFKGYLLKQDSFDLKSASIF